MIDPYVRPARPSDAHALDQLSERARAALADQRGGSRWLDEHPSCDDWQQRSEAGAVLVADLDGLVVGYLIATVESTLLRVDEVYVQPEARELGFGDELLAAAIDVGRRAGATLVEGEALPGDRTIKNLFERAGITARKIVVSAAINDPSTGADASR